MKLELTDQEITIIGKSLALMPYGEVAALVANLQTQINEQQKENNGNAPTAEPTEVE